MPGGFYLLDANVFIEAARRYYAFDLAPKFWESLIVQSKQGTIGSIDKVRLELEKGKDQLAAWAKHDFHDGFLSTNDQAVLDVYKEIMIFVDQQQYSTAAIADFAAGADGWLIAYAKAKGCVVVTHEVVNEDIKRKVPIPNVCLSFDVPFVDTFQMLRQLAIQFS